MASLYTDDNGKHIAGPEGMRPDFATLARASTGAGVAELDISGAVVAANRTQTGARVMLRVVNQGSNACYFALGIAATAPTNADMIIIPANTVEYMRASSADVSAYHQQITGATTIEVCALV